MEREKIGKKGGKGGKEEDKRIKEECAKKEIEGQQERKVKN